LLIILWIFVRINTEIKWLKIMPLKVAYRLKLLGTNFQIETCANCVLKQQLELIVRAKPTALKIE